MNDPTRQRRAAPDDPDAPLTPEQERVVKRMRRMMAVGALIMFAGIGLVFITIAFRLMNTPETVDMSSAGDLGEAVSEILTVAPGETVVSANVSGGMVVVTTAMSDGGGRVLVMDLSTLALRREIRLAPE